MSEVKIITNHHYRDLLSFSELTPAQQERAADLYDWQDSVHDGTYFVYRSDVYILDDYMRLDDRSLFPGDWDGYSSDSFFSGTLVKLSDCGGMVKVALYLS